MPIFKAFGAALLTCVALAGCVGGLGSASAPRVATVTSDAVRITGPSGFCVDPTATRDGGDTGFVLLGNCAVLADSRFVGQPAVPAVLTAAISASGDGGEISENLSALDGFFRSGEGMRLLSRTQEAGTVTILNSAVEGDVFYLQARDTSAGPVDGVQDVYWRAYFDLGARIATLTVLGRADREISSDQSLTILREFVSAVRNSNAAGAATTGTTATGETSAPAVGGRLFDFDLFGGI